MTAHVLRNSCKCISLDCRRVGTKTQQNSRRVEDGEEGLEIVTFDVAYRYDNGQSFVVTNAELGKSCREIDRITRKEVSVDTV